MSELTAVERRDRAVKSLSIAEERLNVIGRMLPELESKLQDSLVRHEISGYRLRAIQKIESEIDSLQKEKASLEKTIEALKKALPEFEKQARLETAEKETVFAYEKAKNEFIELLKGIPALRGLRAK